jgi:hypothetical protein
VESLKVRARKGTDGKEYEYENGDFFRPRRDVSAGHVDVEGDATMGGLSDGEPVPTTIQGRLVKDLQELVTRAAAEIERYDRHAATTKDHYVQAKERRAAARRASEVGSELTSRKTTTSTDPIRDQPREAMTNRDDAAMVDMDALPGFMVDKRNHTTEMVGVPRGPRGTQVDVTQERLPSSNTATRAPRKKVAFAEPNIYRR